MSHRLMQGVLLCLFSSFSYGAAGEHHHFAGIFLGYTNADSHTEFSYGIEYEYKFNQMWGTGFVYEKTDDAHHGDGVDITLGAIYLHPWKELRIGAGFGREKVGGAHSFTQDIKRLSLSYDFHIGGFGLAPTYALDFVDGHTARVFGIALIKAF
ncbi:MAG: hypothetical protein HRT35_28830 [Algicola sp.]|nr:hypothetical protein [Algicola sp.]